MTLKEPLTWPERVTALQDLAVELQNAHGVTMLRVIRDFKRFLPYDLRICELCSGKGYYLPMGELRYENVCPGCNSSGVIEP